MAGSPGFNSTMSRFGPATGNVPQFNGLGSEFQDAGLNYNSPRGPWPNTAAWLRPTGPAFSAQFLSGTPAGAPAGTPAPGGGPPPWAPAWGYGRQHPTGEAAGTSADVMFRGSRGMGGQAPLQDWEVRMASQNPGITDPRNPFASLFGQYGMGGMGSSMDRLFDFQSQRDPFSKRWRKDLRQNLGFNPMPFLQAMGYNKMGAGQPLAPTWQGQNIPDVIRPFGQPGGGA